RFLGRGSAAIAVPPFDGALKPNSLLDEAELVAELEAPEDLAADDKSLFVADGTRVLEYVGTALVEAARVEGPITAIACLPGGGLAVAVNGTVVRIIRGPGAGQSWNEAGGRPFYAINALWATADGRLLASDGSKTQPYERWCHDLMELGKTGRCIEMRMDGGARELATGLAYAFGVCESGGEVWTSESWAHRIRRSGTGPMVLDRLPGYPSRIAPASDGGFWLTVFTARTQLVEFVPREPAYRKRMMKEIDPEFWVAPALRWGRTYQEPMQGAHIKTMGILKPWAPPRAYGLVVRLEADGLMRYSLHSRVDGSNHGVVAAAERRGELFVLAKGARRLLKVSIAQVERSLQG
ncbi:MAG TPA: hypothetical protein VF678_13215, partial [bacterium]